MNRLEEIEARAKAATLGPWHADSLARGIRHLDRNWEPYHEECPDGFWLPGRQGPDGARIDAEFIAHARVDVPWLLSRLRAHDAVVAAAREVRKYPASNAGNGWHEVTLAADDWWAFVQAIDALDAEVKP